MGSGSCVNLSHDVHCLLDKLHVQVTNADTRHPHDRLDNRKRPQVSKSVRSKHQLPYANAERCDTGVRRTDVLEQS